MQPTDPVPNPVLPREARAVLLEVDRMAAATPEMDTSTADLLSRVHKDLQALIDLLEQPGRPGGTTAQSAPGHRQGRTPGCRVLPGEI
jgi:hypothetical protein